MTENRKNNEEILEFVKSYRESKSSFDEAIKPTTIRRKKILWNRVFLAIAGLGLVVTLTIMGVVALFSKEENIKIETDSSSVAESSVPDSKSDDSSKTKHLIVTLSDEEMTTLILAVQHECGRNPEVYLTLEEREKLNSLKAKDVITQDDQQEQYSLEQKARDRLDRAQQLTAATMINRIGKKGFGVDGFSGGTGAKDLVDVLSQPGQYSIVGEDGQIVMSLLEDISHYWELDNADQFDPCDSQTLKNVNKVLSGELNLPTNLVCEIRSEAFASTEEAEQDLKNRNSNSEYVYSYEMIPCSYGNCDYWCVYGINSTGTGFAEPID